MRPNSPQLGLKSLFQLPGVSDKHGHSCCVLFNRDWLLGHILQPGWIPHVQGLFHFLYQTDYQRFQATD